MKDTGERLIVEGNEQNLSYGEHLSRYLSVIDAVKGKVVLDIASGAGYGSQIVAKHAKKVIGVDYSPEAIKYASKKYPASNLSYQVGDAQELADIKDASIDVVVSFETIEHLYEPEKFVNQVKRILKPNGVFIVSTPNDDEFIEGNEFHVHQFDLAELKRLITKNFNKHELYYQGTSLTANLLSEGSFKNAFQDSKLITKTITEKPQKAMYFIAVASNGDLPALTENYVSSQRWSTRDYVVRDTDQEATIKTQRTRIDELEREAESLREKIRTITWKDTPQARKISSRIRKISPK